MSIRKDKGVAQSLPVLLCEIKDRGPGVRVDGDGKGLFDGAAGRSESSGTGLGLRVCKSLCEAMKCEQLGYRENPLPQGGIKGSIFFFRLPLFKEPPSADIIADESLPVSSASRSALSSPTLLKAVSGTVPDLEQVDGGDFEVLLVDDAKVNLRVLEGMLVQKLKVDSNRVFSALSAADALNFLLQRVTTDRRHIVNSFYFFYFFVFNFFFILFYYFF